MCNLQFSSSLLSYFIFITALWFEVWTLGGWESDTNLTSNGWDSKIRYQRRKTQHVEMKTRGGAVVDAWRRWHRIYISEDKPPSKCTKSQKNRVGTQFQTLVLERECVIRERKRFDSSFVISFSLLFPTIVSWKLQTRERKGELVLEQNLFFYLSSQVYNTFSSLRSQILFLVFNYTALIPPQH